MVDRKEKGSVDPRAESYSKQFAFGQIGASPWHEIGQEKTGLGDHYVAIEDYTRAIAIDPTIALAWNNRGMAYFFIGNYTQALADLDQAIKLEPENTIVIRNRKAVEVFKSLYEGETDVEKLLSVRLNKVEYSLRALHILRISLLIFLFAFFFSYWAPYLFYWYGFCESESCVSANGFANTITTTFSRASILFIIAFPIIWGIRIVSKAIDDNNVVGYDLFSRINIEIRLNAFLQGEAMKVARKNIIVRYLRNWMYNNPADRLIQLRQKDKKKKQKQSQDNLDDIPIEAIAKKVVQFMNQEVGKSGKK
ncbi:MAG: tetratricopeptide repeat protein [Proteobacteria bacterium]|nr:tetratricopeptide repeat protein [Pseudomonadota bacterium]